MDRASWTSGAHTGRTKGLVAVYHAELHEAQADAALAALFGRGPASTPFDRLDTLRLLAEECLPGMRCFVAVARNERGICALPLMQDGQGLHSLANWYSFTAAPRWSDRAQAPPLLAAIARSLTPAGALTLAPLPEAQTPVIRDALRDAGWIAAAAPCAVNHVLHVNGRSFAEYWASRPGPLRETVRRKGGKGVVAIRIATAFDAADWAAYETIYAKSWKPEEGSPAFLRRFAQAEADAGALRLGLATIDGQPVAAQFWTVEGGTAFIHKLAHDQAAKAHSPGTLLSAALFEHVIDIDRVSLVDFGTGDDPYKRNWMDGVRTRWRIEAYRPASVRHWRHIARLTARRLLRPSAQSLVSGDAAG